MIQGDLFGEGSGSDLPELWPMCVLGVWVRCPDGVCVFVPTMGKSCWVGALWVEKPLRAGSEELAQLEAELRIVYPGCELEVIY